MCFVLADLPVLLGCLQAEAWRRVAGLSSSQEILRLFTSLVQVISKLTCCVSVDEKTS